jgi:hypothetical protein
VHHQTLKFTVSCTCRRGPASGRRWCWTWMRRWCTPAWTARGSPTLPSLSVCSLSRHPSHCVAQKLPAPSLVGCQSAHPLHVPHRLTRVLVTSHLADKAPDMLLRFRSLWRAGAPRVGAPAAAPGTLPGAGGGAVRGRRLHRLPKGAADLPETLTTGLTLASAAYANAPRPLQRRTVTWTVQSLRLLPTLCLS